VREAVGVALGTLSRHLLERGDAHIVRDIVCFVRRPGFVRAARRPSTHRCLSRPRTSEDRAAELRTCLVASLRMLIIVDPDARKRTMVFLAEPRFDAVNS
jgi:hypothetical protein